MALAVSASALAASVECTEAATGDKVQVKIARIKRGIKDVRRVMKRQGVHILDLPKNVRDHRSRFDEDLAARDWCVVRSHLIAVEDAVANIRIDQGFVSDKFSRVERWLRVGDGAAKKGNAGRLIANAAAYMADSRHEQANGILNRIISMLIGKNDLWELPAESLEPAEDVATQSERVEIESSEVAAGCPVLAKKGRADRDDLTDVINRLGRLMDRRQIRVTDIKGGDALVADLYSYHKLSALWPAARTACAMLSKVKEVPVGLGSTMKRFQRINNLRREKGLPPESKERFHTLVRSATDHISKKEYTQAHAALDELLVLMGDPPKPSRTLP